MDTDIVEYIDFIATVAKAAYDAYIKYQEIHCRRWWVRELNKNRDVEGYFYKNFENMKSKDPEHFFKMTRMSSQTFDLLFVLVEERLQKSSNRKPIEPKCRLFVTLL